MSVGSLHKLCDGSSIDYIVQPVKYKKYPPLRRIFVICVYFDFFLYRRLLYFYYLCCFLFFFYFSSISLPACSLSIICVSLPFLPTSTRHIIFYVFSQLGQRIKTPKVKNKTYQK